MAKGNPMIFDSYQANVPKEKLSNNFGNETEVEVDQKEQIEQEKNYINQVEWSGVEQNGNRNNNKSTKLQ